MKSASSLQTGDEFELGLVGQSNKISNWSWGRIIRLRVQCKLGNNLPHIWDMECYNLRFWMVPVLQTFRS